MYILQYKKKIKFLDLKGKDFDLVLLQLCNFLLFNLQKICFLNLAYKMTKKLEIVEMLVNLSLAVCFSKKKLVKKPKKLLLPHTNIFKYQTDGFDLLYDAGARQRKLTRYTVGWFMGQRPKRTHNFLGARKYVYQESLRHIKAAMRKDKEELQAIINEAKKKKENIFYNMFERFQKRSKKKIRFFERKLYLRMRRQWIDYRLLKIQKGVVRMDKFYKRTQALQKSTVLDFFDKKRQDFRIDFDQNELYPSFNFKYYKRFYNNIKSQADLEPFIGRKKLFMFHSYFNKFSINKNFFFCKLEKKKNA